MTASDLPALPERSIDSHKGCCGRVLVLGGATGMMGAGAMVCQAALRSGVGLVYWAVPKSLNDLAELMSLETITMPIPESAGQAPGVDAREHLLEAAMEVDAVVLGQGLPVAGETGELLRLIIPELRPPLVLDAGGLMAVGDDWKILMKRKGATIITPHPGEMGRLVKKTVSEVQDDREGFAKKYAKVSRSVVVLKGAGTIITDNEKTVVNSTGNPGMATAGSGDVLAGVIGALLAQGMAPFEAAQLGVHLHGLAGDLAAESRGQYGLIAGDIIEALPRAFMNHEKG